MVKNKPSIRLCAWFLSCIMLFSFHIPVPLQAAPASLRPSPARDLFSDVTAIRIPSQIGEVQEFHRGEKDKMVILIQDAHSIPDAQNSIRGLLSFFQSEYGVDLALLEGSAKTYDARIFRSFPDPQLLKSVFKKYLADAELTGATAAAIFAPEEGIYEGIEDWALYESGIEHYLEALSGERDAMMTLAPFKARLEEAKTKNFSADLLNADRAARRFRAEEIDLLQLLQTLKTYKMPPAGSKLEALVLSAETETGPASVDLDMEVKSIARRIQNMFKSMPASAGAFEDLERFNLEKQRYGISEIGPEKFGLFLYKLIKKYRLPIQVSNNLSEKVGQQKKIQDIRGTQLFRDLELYIASVKDALYQSDLERALNRESMRLDLIERLIQLELSQEDWVSLNAFLGAQDSFRIEADGIVAGSELRSLLDGLRPHIAFYVAAHERDLVFMQNVLRSMEKHKRNKAMIVAGGFHTEGLTRQFEKAGISYVLVRPQIDSMPEEYRYREHMRGEVSWREYFEVEDGKVNLYDAFVRGARDALLRQSGEARGEMLKAWRDRIILDLANRGEIDRAGRYVRFIDELSGQNGRLESMRKSWFAAIDNFMDSLQSLKRSDRLDEKNVMSLLQSSYAAEMVLQVLSGDRASAALLRFVLPRTAETVREAEPVERDSEAPRSEMRTQTPLEAYLAELNAFEHFSESEKEAINDVFSRVLQNENGLGRLTVEDLGFAVDSLYNAVHGEGENQIVYPVTAGNILALAELLHDYEGPKYRVTDGVPQILARILENGQTLDLSLEGLQGLYDISAVDQAADAVLNYILSQQPGLFQDFKKVYAVMIRIRSALGNATYDAGEMHNVKQAEQILNRVKQIEFLPGDQARVTVIVGIDGEVTLDLKFAVESISATYGDMNIVKAEGDVISMNDEAVRFFIQERGPAHQGGLAPLLRYFRQSNENVFNHTEELRAIASNTASQQDVINLLSSIQFHDRSLNAGLVELLADLMQTSAADFDLEDYFFPNVISLIHQDKPLLQSFLKRFFQAEYGPFLDRLIGQPVINQMTKDQFENVLVQMEPLLETADYDFIRSQYENASYSGKTLIISMLHKDAAFLRTVLENETDASLRLHALLFYGATGAEGRQYLADLLPQFLADSNLTDFDVQQTSLSQRAADAGIPVNILLKQYSLATLAYNAQLTGLDADRILLLATEVLPRAKVYDIFGKDFEYANSSYQVSTGFTSKYSAAITFQVLGHESGHNALDMLLGIHIPDVKAYNTFSHGFHELVSDVVSMAFAEKTGGAYTDMNPVFEDEAVKHEDSGEKSDPLEGHVLARQVLKDFYPRLAAEGVSPQLYTQVLFDELRKVSAALNLQPVNSSQEMQAIDSDSNLLEKKDRELYAYLAGQTGLAEIEGPLSLDQEAAQRKQIFNTFLERVLVAAQARSEQRSSQEHMGELPESLADFEVNTEAQFYDFVRASLVLVDGMIDELSNSSEKGHLKSNLLQSVRDAVSREDAPLKVHKAFSDFLKGVRHSIPAVNNTNRTARGTLGHIGRAMSRHANRIDRSEQRTISAGEENDLKNYLTGDFLQGSLRPIQVAFDNGISVDAKYIEPLQKAVDILEKMNLEELDRFLGKHPDALDGLFKAVTAHAKIVSPDLSTSLIDFFSQSSNLFAQIRAFEALAELEAAFKKQLEARVSFVSRRPLFSEDKEYEMTSAVDLARRRFFRLERSFEAPVQGLKPNENFLRRVSLMRILAERENTPAEGFSRKLAMFFEAVSIESQRNAFDDFIDRQEAEQLGLRSAAEFVKVVRFIHQKTRFYRSGAGGLLNRLLRSEHLDYRIRSLLMHELVDLYRPANITDPVEIDKFSERASAFIRIILPKNLPGIEIEDAAVLFSAVADFESLHDFVQEDDKLFGLSNLPDEAVFIMLDILKPRSSSLTEASIYKNILNTVITTEKLSFSDDVRLYAYGQLVTLRGETEAVSRRAEKAALNKLRAVDSQKSGYELINGFAGVYHLKINNLAVLLWVRQADIPFLNNDERLRDFVDATMESRLLYDYNNANSAMEFGVELMSRFASQAFLMATAHELMHRVLTYQFRFSSGGIHQGSIHEFISDMLALRMATDLGWSVLPYVNGLRFGADTDAVQKRGYVSNEVHEAARAQFVEFTNSVGDESISTKRILEAVVFALRDHPESARIQKNFGLFTEVFYRKYLDNEAVPQLKPETYVYEDGKTDQVQILSAEQLEQIRLETLGGESGRSEQRMASTQEIQELLGGETGEIAGDIILNTIDAVFISGSEIRMRMATEGNIDFNKLTDADPVRGLFRDMLAAIRNAGGQPGVQAVYLALKQKVDARTATAHEWTLYYVLESLLPDYARSRPAESNLLDAFESKLYVLARGTVDDVFDYLKITNALRTGDPEVQKDACKVCPHASAISTHFLKGPVKKDLGILTDVNIKIANVGDITSFAGARHLWTEIEAEVPQGAGVPALKRKFYFSLVDSQFDFGFDTNVYGRARGRVNVFAFDTDEERDRILRERGIVLTGVQTDNGFHRRELNSLTDIYEDLARLLRQKVKGDEVFEFETDETISARRRDSLAYFSFFNMIGSAMNLVGRNREADIERQAIYDLYEAAQYFEKYSQERSLKIDFSQAEFVIARAALAQVSVRKSNPDAPGIVSVKQIIEILEKFKRDADRPTLSLAIRMLQQIQDEPEQVEQVDHLLGVLAQTEQIVQDYIEERLGVEGIVQFIGADENLLKLVFFNLIFGADNSARAQAALGKLSAELNKGSLGQAAQRLAENMQRTAQRLQFEAQQRARREQENRSEQRTPAEDMANRIQSVLKHGLLSVEEARKLGLAPAQSGDSIAAIAAPVPSKGALVVFTTVQREDDAQDFIDEETSYRDYVGSQARVLLEGAQHKSPVTVVAERRYPDVAKERVYNGDDVLEQRLQHSVLVLLKSEQSEDEWDRREDIEYVDSRSPLILGFQKLDSGLIDAIFVPEAFYEDVTTQLPASARARVRKVSGLRLFEEIAYDPDTQGLRTPDWHTALTEHMVGAAAKASGPVTFMLHGMRFFTADEKRDLEMRRSRTVDAAVLDSLLQSELPDIAALLEQLDRLELWNAMDLFRYGTQNARIVYLQDVILSRLSSVTADLAAVPGELRKLARLAVIFRSIGDLMRDGYTPEKEIRANIEKYQEYFSRDLAANGVLNTESLKRVAVLSGDFVFEDAAKGRIDANTAAATLQKNAEESGLTVASYAAAAKAVFLSERINKAIEVIELNQEETARLSELDKALARSEQRSDAVLSADVSLALAMQIMPQNIRAELGALVQTGRQLNLQQIAAQSIDLASRDLFNAGRSSMKQAALGALLASLDEPRGSIVRTQAELDAYNAQGQALFATLAALGNRQYSVGVALSNDSSAARPLLIDELLKIMRAGDVNVSELIFDGKLQAATQKEFTDLGAMVRSHNYRRSLILYNNQPAVPLLTLRSLDGAPNEMFIPFSANLEGIDDQFVQAYVETLRAVAAIHTADLISRDRTLLLNPDRLKGELLSRLQRFGDAYENILTRKGDGWVVMGTVARAQLEMAIAKATAASA